MTRAITVRFVSSKTTYTDEHATRQFPGGVHQWGDVQFVFTDCTDYDWLVVYHDLPYKSGMIELACPRANTIIITHEPSAIKSYGRDFVAQFGWMLSCHEAEILPHTRRIPMQPGSIWFYGSDLYDTPARGKYDYTALKSTPPPQKTHLLSTVCSDKKMKHTAHYRRFRFTQELKQAIPELDIFGHGVNTIKQKADALDPYRYHLTIENDYCPDYWTEKIADAFLGYTLPFYYGCPNAEDYFPPESFIRINIDDFAGSLQIIRQAIADNEYEKRLPHIIEARRRVLEEHNLYAMVARQVAQLPAAPDGSRGGKLYSRYQLMYKNPLAAARYAVEKLTRLHRLRRIRS